MADAKISALPSATVPLAGTEVLPIVQSSVTDKVTAADLLRQNGQTVTTSNPVLSLAQTWNAGGVTFTGLKFNATNTASASGSLLLDLQVGGTSQFKVDRTGIVTAQSAVAGTVGWFQSSVVLGSLTGGDTILTREAANTLALRNSTNAQTFRLYTTYTDASNYERLSIVGNAGSVFQIITQNAGTGTSRALRFGVGGTGIFDIATTGHLNWVTDNTYDIGASGATRPRSIYAGTSIVSGVNFIVTAGGSYNFSGRSLILSPSDGVLQLSNAAITDFSRLQFGGTTSSFPALKRSSVELQFRLADDSNWAGAQALSYKMPNGQLIYGDGSAGFVFQDNSGSATTLAVEANNVLAQRNSTNAQTFNIYNTYTDSSNFERFAIKAQSGNDVRLQTEKAGTGTARSLIFGTDANVRWLIGATSGHFLAGADNTYDIGASGANRPRTIYVGSNVVVGTQIQAGSFITAGNGSYIGITSSFFMDSASSGVVAIKNWAGTDFSRLQFGGTTSSFPAIKRNAATFDFRLADDSNYCSIAASSLALSSAMSIYGASAIPAGGSTGAGYKLSSTANFGVFFGSGAPTLSAAKGSLYLRSDGTTTNDRMYVNTDGSTSWTAVTTAA